MLIDISYISINYQIFASLNRKKSINMKINSLDDNTSCSKNDIS